MTTLIVTLPPPPTVLNPNRTSHWRTKAKAVKQYRNDAHIAAYTALNEMDRWHSNRPRWKQAVMTPKFYFRDRRRRDRDNFQAALKAACDGLVDAGVLIDDSGLATMPAEFDIDGNDPRVELHLRELQEGMPYASND